MTKCANPAPIVTKRLGTRTREAAGGDAFVSRYLDIQVPGCFGLVLSQPREGGGIVSMGTTM